jgi:hypothetical protein
MATLYSQYTRALIFENIRKARIMMDLFSCVVAEDQKFAPEARSRGEVDVGGAEGGVGTREQAIPGLDWQRSGASEETSAQTDNVPFSVPGPGGLQQQEDVPPATG